MVLNNANIIYPQLALVLSILPTYLLATHIISLLTEQSSDHHLSSSVLYKTVSWFIYACQEMQLLQEYPIDGQRVHDRRQVETWACLWSSRKLEVSPLIVNHFNKTQVRFHPTTDDCWYEIKNHIPVQYYLLYANIIYLNTYIKKLIQLPLKALVDYASLVYFTNLDSCVCSCFKGTSHCTRVCSGNVLDDTKKVYPLVFSPHWLV